MDETKMLESFFPRVGREEEKEKGKEAAASKLPAPFFRIHNPVSSIGFFFHRRITISNLFLAASIFRGSTHDRIIHDAWRVWIEVDSFTRDEIGNYVIFAGDHDNLVND